MAEFTVKILEKGKDYTTFTEHAESKEKLLEALSLVYHWPMEILINPPDKHTQDVEPAQLLNI